MRSDFFAKVPLAPIGLAMRDALRFTRLTRTAKKLFRNIGLEVRVVGGSEPAPGYPDIVHSQIWPFATYSPWLTDREFNRVIEVIKENTLLDYYICYDLWELIGQVAKLQSGDLIEIGTWRGGSGSLIAKRAELEGIDAKVYLCDTFRGVVKASALDPVYRGGEHADASVEAVRNLIHRLNLHNVEVLQGTFPDDTGKSLADKTFRFCHIDVDVYRSAAEIVEWIWPRLCLGGLIVYDDYGFKGCEGVTRFVNEERGLPDRLIIHNLNGHAVAIKTPTVHNFSKTTTSSVEPLALAKAT
ncbi:MAG: methyltransferase [Acidobacteria bacterium]|nr:MAG: methyltransferase [Acidobacteriota bacterium]